jgi:hypothetical protein
MGMNGGFEMEQLDWKLLKAVYAGGIRRGADEASAYEWGAHPTGKQYDDLAEAIHDHVNDGRKYDDPAYVSWAAVEAAVAANVP